MAGAWLAVCHVLCAPTSGLAAIPLSLFSLRASCPAVVCGSLHCVTVTSTPNSVAVVQG